MEADRVVYVGLVSEVVSLEVYGSSPRFAAKRPRVSGETWRRHGDSIHFKADDGRWLQRRNPHHDREAMTRDLGGRNALICQRFWYFGALAPTLPGELHRLIKSGPGHKRTRDSDVLVRLQRWLESWPQGVVPGDAVRSEVPCTVAHGGDPAQASAACRMRRPARR